MNLVDDITDFLFFIPIIVLGCIFFSYLKFKRLANPITFMSLWWGGWLFISNLSLTGIYLPGVHTQSLVILMILSYTLGALIIFRKKKRNDIKTNINFFKKFTLILNILYPTLFLLILPFFFKAIYLFRSLTLIELENYRIESFGSKDEISILYGSNQIELFYSILVYPLLLLCLVISSIFLYAYGIRRYIVLSGLLNFCKSIMTLGRFDIYFILFFLIILGILFNKNILGKINLNLVLQRRKFRKRIWGFQLFLIATILIGIVLISVKRAFGQGTQSLYENISNFLITYHTCGFVLFDQQLENQSSVLSQNITYGLATVSGLERLLFLLITRFNKDFSGILPMLIGGQDKIILELNSFMNDFQRIAPDKYSNAFYTMLYDFYLDGRELGVFVFSFILGYVTSFFYQDWLKTNNFYSLAWLLLLLYLTLMSIFQSIFESLTYWIVMLLLLLIQNSKYLLLNKR